MQKRVVSSRFCVGKADILGLAVFVVTLGVSATYSTRTDWVVRGWNDMLTNGVGKQIRSWRKRRELTQKQLAARMGVDPSTISRWEKDEQGLTLNNAHRLANALGTIIGSFISKDAPTGGGSGDVITRIMSAHGTASVSELQKNPIGTVAAGEGRPVAILDQNEPALFY